MVFFSVGFAAPSRAQAHVCPWFRELHRPVGLLFFYNCSKAGGGNKSFPKSKQSEAKLVDVFFMHVPDEFS